MKKSTIAIVTGFALVQSNAYAVSHLWKSQEKSRKEMIGKITEFVGSENFAVGTDDYGKTDDVTYEGKNEKGACSVKVSIRSTGHALVYVTQGDETEYFTTFDYVNSTKVSGNKLEAKMFDFTWFGKPSTSGSPEGGMAAAMVAVPSFYAVQYATAGAFADKSKSGLIIQKDDAGQVSGVELTFQNKYIQDGASRSVKCNDLQKSASTDNAVAGESASTSSLRNRKSVPQNGAQTIPCVKQSVGKFLCSGVLKGQ